MNHFITYEPHMFCTFSYYVLCSNSRFFVRGKIGKLNLGEDVECINFN